MNETYLQAVATHLAHLSRADRERALSALAAQLDELAESGDDPRTTLGSPADYAAYLNEALAEEPAADSPRWRLFGLPVETRGPVSAAVRSRTWDPGNPRIFVPRLFGIGWTINLGAVAVRLGLIRPDDVDEDVLEHIPPRDVQIAQAVPLVIAGATAASVALAWRGLPPTVASGFRLGGRPRGESSRWILLFPVALGLVPALWAQFRGPSVEDRLVRSASASSLAVLGAGVVASTVTQAHRPQGRWGLLGTVALPAAVGTALGVMVLPLRSGLRRVWRAAEPA